MGGYFGAKLAQAGEQVWFAARGPHLAAMQAHGLRVAAVDETFVVPAGRMVADLAGVGTADVVLFCVKSYDTEDAARLLRPVLKEDTRILCLQNGVQAEDDLRKCLSGAPGVITAGSAYVYASVTEPGTVTQTGGPRRIVLGEAFANDTRAHEMVATLLRAGVRGELSSDISAALWSKFVFISAVGGLTALMRQTLGEILAVPAAMRVLDRAMRETEGVARALDVQLPAGIVETIFETFRTMNTNTYSSLYHDLVAGKPLEIDALAGSVGRQGARVGVATPTHDVIYAALLPQHEAALAARKRYS